MAQQGRPILVWIIFLLTMFMTAAWGFSTLVTLTVDVPMGAETRAAFDDITVADYVLGFFQTLFYLVAGIALFMMRRVALYFYVAAVCLDFGVLVWTFMDASRKARLTADSDLALIGGVVGLGVAFAICLYALKLTLSERLA